MNQPIRVTIGGNRGPWGKPMVLGSLVLAFVSLSSGRARAGEVLHLQGGSRVLPRFQPHRLSDLERQQRVSGMSRFGEGLQVIQFDRAPTQADRDALEAAGFEVLRYLPEDAYLVRSPAKSMASILGARVSTRAFGIFEPQWKLSPELRGASGAQSLSVLVSAFTSRDADRLAEQLLAMPAVRIRHRDGRDFAVDLHASSLASIAESPSVEWVQTLPVIVSFELDLGDEEVMNEPAPTPPVLTGGETGTRLMGFEEAWARGLAGEGEQVAVADTGLDTGDLSTLNADFSSGLEKAYVSGLGGESWGDPQGHGTHVMGSVLGRGELSSGMLKGGAYRARLHAQGMWSGIFNNIMPPSDFRKLMSEPFASGARVHSNSWGSPNNLGAYDIMAVRADEVAWEHPEMLIVFAAGNSGQDSDRDGRVDEGSISSPSTAKNVLTVGASENVVAQGGIQRPLSQLRDGDRKWGVPPLASDTLSNDEHGIAAFSSRGPTQDGRLKPEIVAPGTNIISTRSHHPQAGVLWGAYDENYAYAGGTSMATPLTAGAAAVTRHWIRREKGIQNPSAALVKAAMMMTAEDLFPGQYGTGPTQELPTPRPNVHQGFGRVNLAAMVRASNSGLHLADERSGVLAGETRSIELRVPAGSTVQALLVYTDAPGTAAASKALVNDLDLRLETANGIALAAASGSVNNHEYVESRVDRASKVRVAVTGVSIPVGQSGTGRQPYALVIAVR